MYPDLKSHFVLEVESSYQSYLKIKDKPVMGTKADLRKALECASALYHFGEHFSIFLNRQFNNNFNEEIKPLSSDYSLLRDVVNIHKHHTINRGKNLQLNSTNQIKEVLCIIEYQDLLGKYRYSEKIIELRLNNGSYRDLHEVLNNVINTWFILLELFWFDLQ